jgi:hypothetical protein
MRGPGEGYSDVIIRVARGCRENAPDPNDPLLAVDANQPLGREGGGHRMHRRAHGGVRPADRVLLLVADWRNFLLSPLD